MADFEIALGDTRPYLVATLSDPEGNPLDLTGADVQLNVSPKVGATRSLSVACTVVGQGQVQYQWQPTDTTTLGAGSFVFDFQVTYQDGSIETIPAAAPLTMVVNQGV